MILLTIAAAALTGHSRASCEAISVTVSIFSSFFCHSMVRATQSANSSSLWLWLSCSTPRKNLMFLSLSISVLRWSGFATCRYSQERMAKKIPMVASLLMACSRSVPSWWTSSLMTEIGIAFWCFSSGSVFLNDLNSRYRMNAGRPSSSMDGFEYLFSQKGHASILHGIFDCACSQSFMRCS